MKEYRLLRANTQSGPYTTEALRALPLRPADLVWVEGESERWEPVYERPELKEFVREEPRRRPAPLPARPRPAAVIDEVTLAAPAIPVRTRGFRPFEFRPAERPAPNGLWILALFVCLVGGAGVVKKIIENGNALAHSPALAMATEPLPEQSEEHSSGDADAGFNYQNALKTETVLPGEDAARSASNVSLRDLRRDVTLSTNSDKEGVFEGINDLQIRVHNNSGRTLDQVNLEVTFLKADGSLIRRETYSVNALAPGGDKILVVPPVRHGARVKYKLTGVESTVNAEQTPA
ncbi:FxLYD domain-containing protein [Flaviaesturariibacter terrae]